MALRLLLSCILLTTGFSAEISMLVQTGASLQLDIRTQEKLPDFDDFSWKNEKSENIAKYSSESKKVKLHDSYKNRVDFNNKSFSLTLKDTQKTDSGVYTAIASGQSDNNIVTYRVSVIDAVESPVLAVNSSWSSPDPCSFTCNGRYIIISSIYNSSSCSPEEVTSSDNHILRLNCSGDSIMCNYSNPVSWKNDTKKVNELCTVNQGPERLQAKEASLHLLWLIPVCLFTIGSLVVFGKLKKGAQKNEQTIYAEVDDNNKPQKSLEMLKKSENPQTVYDTAKDPGQTDVTIHTTPNDDHMNQVNVKQ
ncbi:hypothetical protein QQF64_015560 [Cirrhinus molitorella]|uniref:Immunoglobulin domain-containing protein n=1 Tax=Cirrhinus molitorella TaxID=172907 RepID=A0ABR3NWT1_9TELE